MVAIVRERSQFEAYRKAGGSLQDYANKQSTRASEATLALEKLIPPR
jgi:hypothetical protein